MAPNISINPLRSKDFCFDDESEETTVADDDADACGVRLGISEDCKNGLQLLSCRVQDSKVWRERPLLVISFGLKIPSYKKLSTTHFNQTHKIPKLPPEYYWASPDYCISKKNI
jgi:hypothetical protein